MRKTLGSRERERPKTATLPHPSILDETLKDKVDMTLTKKDLLAAVKLCNDGSGAHATNPTRYNLVLLHISLISLLVSPQNCLQPGPAEKTAAVQQCRRDWVQQWER